MNTTYMFMRAGLATTSRCGWRSEMQRILFNEFRIYNVLHIDLFYIDFIIIIRILEFSQ